VCISGKRRFIDGYCSAVQGLLDRFEVDLVLTKLLFIQTDLCVACVSERTRVRARVEIHRNRK